MKRLPARKEGTSSRSTWFSAMRAIAVGIALGVGAAAQVSPAEHAKHHPGQQGPGQQGAGAAPGSQADGAGDAGGMGMGGMGEMMKSMGVPPPKELYPSLMALPDLPLEARAEVQAKAHERMRSGTSRMSEGLDRLAAAAPGSDWQLMQAAVAMIRDGVAELDSGLAAHRALAEGQAPRSVAMRWFKTEMSMLSPVSQPVSPGPMGLGWFHFSAMVALIAFTGAMVWMYFHKMRRAASLIDALTERRGGSQEAGGLGAGTEATASAEGRSSSEASRSATKPGRWAGKLRICRVFEETPTIKTFRLIAEGGSMVPFQFQAGQFLTVAVKIGEKVVKRSYTIASAPSVQGYVEITVKREENGKVSKHLHDQVKEGDALDVSAPMGKFCFTGKESSSIVLIGAGVGVTPLMSVVRYLTDIGWPGHVTLLFACRDQREFLFRAELEALQRRHSNLSVVTTLTREEDESWKGPRGRLTKDMIASSVPDLPKQRIHVCGPKPMMEATKDILAELGVPAANIKTEAFGGRKEKLRGSSGDPQDAEGVARAVDTPDVATQASVAFARSGKSGSFDRDDTILDVADRIGVDIDNSCRAGTCGSCKVRLLEGAVEMEIEDGLEPGEKESGWVLACQAKSSASVKVDA